MENPYLALTRGILKKFQLERENVPGEHYDLFRQHARPSELADAFSPVLERTARESIELGASKQLEQDNARLQFIQHGITRILDSERFPADHEDVDGLCSCMAHRINRVIERARRAIDEVAMLSLENVADRVRSEPCGPCAAGKHQECVVALTGGLAFRTFVCDCTHGKELPAPLNPPCKSCFRPMVEDRRGGYMGGYMCVSAECPAGQPGAPMSCRNVVECHDRAEADGVTLRDHLQAHHPERLEPIKRK